MRASVLPPLTGSALFDPWRLRYREQLASGAQAPRERRATRSEELLWAALQAAPREWVAEHPTVHGYSLDFYCPAARLAVEVDGGSHWGAAASAHDAWRDEVHGRLGIRTHRFSAHDVENEVEWVAAEAERLAAAREAELAAGGGEVRVAAAERPRTRVFAVVPFGDPAPGTAEGVPVVEAATAARGATEDSTPAEPVLSDRSLTVEELTALVSAEVEGDERLLAFPPAPPGWSTTLPACRTVLPAQAAPLSGLQRLLGR